MYLLALIGFDPELGADNAYEHMLGLRLLFTMLPSVFFFWAAAIVWNYPITEARHARMRDALQRRMDRRAAG
jgi:Na+/melibiose symporter-like transporter